MSFYAQAQSGTKTIVQAHQNVDLIWQGAPPFGKHDQIVNFPNGSKNYQSIIMNYTLGCGSNGVCSHWDYDVDILLGDYTGTYDSTIASFDTINYVPWIFDTISQAPLTIDTVQFYVFEADTNWNVFEVIEWHELGRMITPYGNYMDWTQNGFDDTWTHTFKYDVTDFAQLLQGDVPIRVNYHGWQDGWRVYVDFEFVEGNPTRDVLSVENVYAGGNYTTFSQFDTEITPSKTLSVPANATEAKLRVIITGHGQAGEFTPINYTLKSNGTNIGTEELWRDDCDMLHTFPQGGTWIYSRANWCPGDAVEIHEFELTDFIQGTGANKTVNVDIDFQNYSPPAGQAYYSISAQLITYETYRRDYDVMLEAIVSPSIDENFTRFNPTCGEPIVRIKNYGKQTLNSAEIEYWIDHTNKFYFDWTGSLAPGESADVSLPAMNWTNLDVNNMEFFAKVYWPNNLPDQFPHNNQKSSMFVSPTVFNLNNITVRFRTNDKPQENSYTVTKSDGTVIANETTFAASTFNNENLVLTDGCYEFVMSDYGDDWEAGDGLSWWVNTQNGIETAGYVEFRNTSNNAVIQSFQRDFGAELRFPFLINSNLAAITGASSNVQSEHPDTIPYLAPNGEYFLQVYDTIWISEDRIVYSENAPTSIGKAQEALAIEIFPNPSSDKVSIVVSSENQTDVAVSVWNVLGEKVDEFSVKPNRNQSYSFHNLPTGIYFFNFQLDDAILSKKVIFVD